MSKKKPAKKSVPVPPPVPTTSDIAVDVAFSELYVALDTLRSRVANLEHEVEFLRQQKPKSFWSLFGG
jgi:hypothetical protein